MVKARQVLAKVSTYGQVLLGARVRTCVGRVGWSMSSVISTVISIVNSIIV